MNEMTKVIAYVLQLIQKEQNFKFCSSTFFSAQLFQAQILTLAYTTITVSATMYNCLELSRLDFHLPPEEPGPPCPCSEVWSNPTKVVFDLRLVPYPWVIFKLCLELDYRSFYGLLPLLYKLLKFTGGKGSEGSFFFSIFSFFLPCMVFCLHNCSGYQKENFLECDQIFSKFTQAEKKAASKSFLKATSKDKASEDLPDAFFSQGNLEKHKK